MCFQCRETDWLFGSSSVEEAQAAVSNLESLIRRVLEINRDVAWRLRSLELQLNASTRHAGPQYQSITETVEADSNSTSGNTMDTTRDQTDERVRVQESTETTNVDPGFEKELHASQVYRRTTFKHSNSSLPSSAVRALDWSFLTGLSLANVSDISVISLPIPLQDLWNPPPYGLERSQNLRLDSHPEIPEGGSRVLRCLLLGTFPDGGRRTDCHCLQSKSGYVTRLLTTQLHRSRTGG